VGGTSTLGARLSARLRDALPTGSALPEETWQARHRAITLLLWAHVVALPFVGLWQDRGLVHSLTETAPVVGLGLAATVSGAPRVVRASLTTLGLVLCSALLVHLFHGLIELHFHFFVVIAVISLYQMWTPYLLGVGFVLAHHATMGLVAPLQVFNHPLAMEHPILFALVHGGFLLAESIACLAYWRANERTLEDERAARESAEESNLALSTAHAEISDLVGMLSHDLRSPLTSINGFTQILREAHDLPAERSDDLLRRIAEAGRNLELMLDDALSATALEANGLLPEPQPVRLDQAVGDVLELMPVPLPGADLSRLEPVLALVDPGHLAQILTNLVTNAQKYGAAPYVFATWVRGQETGLTVTDHGSGVPPDFEARLFERFARADRHRSGGIKGTGLGLYIAHRLAQANDGGLSHRRSESGGAEFRLTLPRVALPASRTQPGDLRQPLAEQPG
jgi:signal transduction histidine kinase